MIFCIPSSVCLWTVKDSHQMGKQIRCVQGQLMHLGSECTGGSHQSRGGWKLNIWMRWLVRTKRRRLGHGLRTLQMLMFGKAVDLHSFERRGDLRVEATALKVCYRNQRK